MTGGNPGEAGNHPTGGNIGAPGGAEVVSAGADGTAGADEATGAGGTIVSHGDAAGVQPREARGVQTGAKLECIVRPGTATDEHDIALHAHRIIHIRDGKVEKDERVLKPVLG